MSVRTIVVTTMTRVDSALRASALHCLKAIHSVRTIVLVTTMVGAIVLVRDKVVTSLVRVATSLVKVRKAAISPVRVDTSLARGAISLVRGDTSLVRVRMVAISPARADTSARVATSLVRDRVAISSAQGAIRDLMASRILIRRVRASIRQTTIQMQSTA